MIHPVLHSCTVILSFWDNSGLFNILGTKRRNETKFCIHIIIDKIYFGIVRDQAIFIGTMGPVQLKIQAKKECLLKRILTTNVIAE